MCYAKPGPRCYSHANERYEKAAEKTAKAIEEMASCDQERNNIREEIGEGTSTQEQENRLKELQPKSIEVRDKYREARSAEQVLLAERDATKIGIENLREQCRALESDDYNSEHYPRGVSRLRLEKRLEVAQEVYKKSIEAHDDEYGTVGGRQASPYGSEKGIEILRERMSSVRVKLRQALRDEDRDMETIDALSKKHGAIQEQFNHARQTELRARSGKVDPYRASLAGNKEELKEVEKKHEQVKATLKEHGDAHRNYPMKAIRDFEETHSDVPNPRWNAEVKREHAELTDIALNNYAKNVSPYIGEALRLDERKRNLEVAVVWGEMSDEDRAKVQDKAKPQVV